MADSYAAGLRAKPVRLSISLMDIRVVVPQRLKAFNGATSVNHSKLLLAFKLAG